MYKFEEIFAEEELLQTTVILSLVFFGANAIFKALAGMYTLAIGTVILFLCILFLFISFRKHNKNVQKGLFGAVLMYYLYDEITLLFGNIIFSEAGRVQYSTKEGTLYIVCNIITLVLYIALFINHFLINSDHHSKSVSVLFNLIIAIIFIAVSVLGIVFQLTVFKEAIYFALESISWHLGIILFVIMIVCYESLIDKYKVRREEFGNL